MLKIIHSSTDLYFSKVNQKFLYKSSLTKSKTEETIREEQKQKYRFLPDYLDPVLQAHHSLGHCVSCF